ncbi:MAG: AMP-binding protein [Myxococcota bacterium]
MAHRPVQDPSRRMHVPTIAELVRQHAQRAPDGVALRWPDADFDRDAPSWRTVTWGDLEAKSDAFARGLRARGTKAGARVALFLRAGPEWLALALACWKLGAVAVVTPRRLDAQRALQALRRARPQGLVGSPWLHRLRPLFADAFASVELGVATGNPWLWGGVKLDELEEAGPPVALPEPDAEAHVLIELAEGVARTLSHRHLEARWGLPAETRAMALETDWSRVLGHVAAGRPTVWPRSDPQLPSSLMPDDWRAAIAHHEVSVLVGGPEIFGRPPPDDVLGRLDHAVVVGPPLAGQRMEAWGDRLTGAILTAVWEAADTGPVARIRAREVRTETLEKTRQGAGYCVGRPVDGVTVDVVAITEGPLASLPEAPRVPGVMGEIVMSGPGAVIDYPDDAEHEEQVVVEDRWRRTGWLGTLDEDGRIWLGGEIDHRLETASGLVAPLAVEGVFEGHPDLVDCVLVGIGPRGSEVPVLVVQLREGRSPSPDLEARLRDRASGTTVRGIVRRFLVHPRIPLGAHGPDRTALRAWAEQRCSDLVREES